MKRKGLLMVELMIALTIIAIMAGSVSMSFSRYGMTAKREAERIFAKLNSLIRKADKTKTHFGIKLNSSKINITWNSKYTNIWKKADLFTETLNASNSCSYSWNAPGKELTYSYITNRFSQGTTIDVECKGEHYYIVIAAVGGRIRLSATHPNKEPDYTE